MVLLLMTSAHSQARPLQTQDGFPESLNYILFYHDEKKSLSILDKKSMVMS